MGAVTDPAPGASDRAMALGELGREPEPPTETEMLLRRGVRVRTLLSLRWVGVVGQGVGLGGVVLWLDNPLALAVWLALIFASVVVNLFLSFTRRSGSWLSEFEAALHLGYDIVQLSALLFLTGGLQNPFAILMLAPVTVSATILSSTFTIVLSALTCVAFSVLALMYQPLPWEAAGFTLPTRYLIGLWTALIVATGFIAAYVGRVSTEAHRMASALATTQWSLAREQRLSALGGLAAAVAHRLGSPLGTIAVVARELDRDLPPDSPLKEDVDLLLSESARCRDILAELAFDPDTDGGAPFESPPLGALIDELVEGLHNPDVDVVIRREALDGSTEPLVLRRPEIMHGVENFLVNAAQFARSTVVVTLAWSERQVSVVVEDDGPGFPPQVRARFGEPYISTRAGQQSHMGLGMFIATTLLSRTRARVVIANRQDSGEPGAAPPQTGARVAIRWRRADIEAR